MKIEIIIRDGLVESVLGDDEALQNADIEIVDNDEDYEDAEKIAKYTNQLYDMDGMNDIPFTSVHFSED